MTRTMTQDSTDHRAWFLILDFEGEPWTGVVYNEDGLVVQYTREGSTATPITLTALNWHEDGNGWYMVDIPDALYETSGYVHFSGAITFGNVIGEGHEILPLIKHYRNIDTLKEATVEIRDI